MTAPQSRAAPPGRPRRSARDRRGDRGGAAVELAVLWPAILLLLLGSVQVTTYFTARTVALSAAQTGAAAARQYDADPAVGRQYAEQYLTEAGDWLVDAEVDPVVVTDDHVFVTVRGRALSIIPGVTWEISQTARGTREQFTTP